MAESITIGVGNQTITLTVGDPEPQFYQNGLQDEVSESESEPFTMTFKYNGVIRVVENPTVTPGVDGANLSGFELYKGAWSSNEYKHYKLYKIQAV